MLFNSVNFLCFFPIVVLIYYIIPARLKNVWLLLASYFFYMCWNAKYAILILISTTVTYISGLIIGRVHEADVNNLKKEQFNKAIVILSVFVNLGILFYFKYFNFALSILRGVLNRIHVNISIPIFDIILPVGISFYTFQALSYTIDVYRNETKVEKNFIRYALFVSFFPQLVAGPIERSKNLLKQLSGGRKFDFDNFREGMLLMLWGYFLKIVVADRISIFVDTVYGDIVAHTGFYLVVATILFVIQVYCDFAGYSVIAMGAAKILGIQLMENFNAPFFSLTIVEFWRKWHISLTTWFRDYLYNPIVYSSSMKKLGRWLNPRIGKRSSNNVRKTLALSVTWILSGLWHGAAFSFVIWGGLQGVFQILSEFLMPVRKRVIKFLRLDDHSLGYKAAQALTTFVLFDFTSIFFRANSARKALEVIRLMFVSDKNMGLLFDGSLYNCGLDEKNYWVMIFGIMLIAFADYLKHKGIKVREVIMRQDYPIRCIVYIGAILGILLFGKWGPVFDKAAFIYFQF